MTNAQCVAYAIIGMLEAGLDAEKVREVEINMLRAFDCFTEDEALEEAEKALRG